MAAIAERQREGLSEILGRDAFAGYGSFFVPKCALRSASTLNELVAFDGHFRSFFASEVELEFLSILREIFNFALVLHDLHFLFFVDQSLGWVGL